MLTVVARALKTPDRHTGCGNKEQPVRRSPMRNAALRRARFVVPRRRPRRPRHRPRQQSCHVLCSTPRRSLPTRCRRDAPTRRHMHRANPDRVRIGSAGWCLVTPTASGFHGVDPARGINLFKSLAGSFRHIPQAGKRHADLSRHSAQHDGGGRDSSVWPPAT